MSNDRSDIDAIYVAMRRFYNYNGKQPNQVIIGRDRWTRLMQNVTPHELGSAVRFIGVERYPRIFGLQVSIVDEDGRLAVGTVEEL